jgi:hypothetical protein
MSVSHLTAILEDLRRGGATPTAVVADLLPCFEAALQALEAPPPLDDVAAFFITRALPTFVRYVRKDRQAHSVFGYYMIFLHSSIPVPVQTIGVVAIGV